MENKFCWGLKVDDEMYRIKCLVTDTEYQVYINKELQWTVDRVPGEALDEELEVGSNVYRLTEDQDRIILNRNGVAMMNMAETRAKRAKPVKRSANLQLTLGVASLALSAGRLANGYTLGQLSMLLIFGVAMIGLSIYQQYNLKKQLRAAEKMEEEEY